MLDDDTWRHIRASLASAGKGRTLTGDVDVGRVRLRKGDALMPSLKLLDVGKAFDARNPGHVTFWRSNENSAVKFRNFFFGTEIGTEPDRLLGPDWLHGFSLGALKIWNGYVFWKLVDVDVWCARRAGAAGNLLGLSLARMRADLFSWYGLERARAHVWTRVQDIKPGMCGASDVPTMNLDASEASGFLHFTGWLLER